MRSIIVLIITLLILSGSTSHADILARISDSKFVRSGEVVSRYYLEEQIKKLEEDARAINEDARSRISAIQSKIGLINSEILEIDGWGESKSKILKVEKFVEIDPEIYK